MDLVCKRLPANEETLKFISPFFQFEHVRDAIDDRWKTYYGIFCLFTGILTGQIRLFGVFDREEPMKFLGFQLGYLDESGKTYENHAFWDRHVPTVECIELCKKAVKADYASDGVDVKYAASYIPDRNRAAKWLALRSGCKDKGLSRDRFFSKDGYMLPCREFRCEL